MGRNSSTRPVSVLRNLSMGYLPIHRLHRSCVICEICELKMPPAPRFEFPGPRGFGNLHAFRRTLNRADACNLDTIDFSRQASSLFRLYREEQLEIFPTVKRKLERIQSAPP